MTFRLNCEFEEILREIPPAARYIDLYWSIASTHADWQTIRSRMAGAYLAVQYIDHDAAAIYAMLRDVAAQRALECLPASVYSIEAAA